MPFIIKDSEIPGRVEEMFYGYNWGAYGTYVPEIFYGKLLVLIYLCSNTSCGNFLTGNDYYGEIRNLGDKIQFIAEKGNAPIYAVINKEMPISIEQTSYNDDITNFIIRVRNELANSKYKCFAMQFVGDGWDKKLIYGGGS